MLGEVDANLGESHIEVGTVSRRTRVQARARSTASEDTLKTVSVRPSKQRAEREEIPGQTGLVLD